MLNLPKQSLVFFQALIALLFTNIVQSAEPEEVFCISPGIDDYNFSLPESNVLTNFAPLPSLFGVHADGTIGVEDLDHKGILLFSPEGIFLNKLFYPEKDSVRTPSEILAFKDDALYCYFYPMQDFPLIVKWNLTNDSVDTVYFEWDKIGLDDYRRPHNGSIDYCLLGLPKYQEGYFIFRGREPDKQSLVFDENGSFIRKAPFSFWSNKGFGCSLYVSGFGNKATFYFTANDSIDGQIHRTLEFIPGKIANERGYYFTGFDNEGIAYFIARTDSDEGLVIEVVTFNAFTEEYLVTSKIISSSADNMPKLISWRVDKRGGLLINTVQPFTKWEFDPDIIAPKSFRLLNPRDLRLRFYRFPISK